MPFRRAHFAAHFERPTSQGSTSQGRPAKSRPELEKCLDSLREEDTLVVWRLDRFGRSLKDLVSKMETLEEQGVDFVSVTEGIDITTAQGKLTFHIFGALADFERELGRERTMAGLQAVRYGEVVSVRAKVGGGSA